MVFSQDETKLAYLAEKKLPKAESFLEFKDNNSNQEKEVRKVSSNKPEFKNK